MNQTICLYIAAKYPGVDTTNIKTIITSPELWKDELFIDMIINIINNTISIFDDKLIEVAIDNKLPFRFINCLINNDFSLEVNPKLNELNEHIKYAISACVMDLESMLSANTEIWDYFVKYRNHAADLYDTDKVAFSQFSSIVVGLQRCRRLVELGKEFTTIMYDSIAYSNFCHPLLPEFKKLLKTEEITNEQILALPIGRLFEIAALLNQHFASKYRMLNNN